MFTFHSDDREENDFYATDPIAIIKLLDLLQWGQERKVVRENSCGQGHLSKALEAAGHTVISTDLIDRGYGVPGIDFLKPSWIDQMPVDAIIMNPPYKCAKDFVEKSLTLAPVVCAFLRITFLESRRRAEFFKKFPPRYVGVFIDRIPCSKNAIFAEDESSTVCYAWFVWQCGYSGAPEVRWI